MTENERLNNALIAAIEERDRLRGERDHFRDCISAREVRKIVDERDALRERVAEQMAWEGRAVASMNEASLAAGVGCCDQIPEAIAKLRAERDREIFLRQQSEDLCAAIQDQRDAAFKMSKCECGPDECCANLVRMGADLAAARAALAEARVWLYDHTPDPVIARIDAALALAGKVAK